MDNISDSGLLLLREISELSKSFNSDISIGKEDNILTVKIPLTKNLRITWSYSLIANNWGVYMY